MHGDLNLTFKLFLYKLIIMKLFKASHALSLLIRTVELSPYII